MQDVMMHLDATNFTNWLAQAQEIACDFIREIRLNKQRAAKFVKFVKFVVKKTYAAKICVARPLVACYHRDARICVICG